MRYHQALLSDEGASAYSYLTEERGLNEKTIDEFKLGVVGEGCDEDHASMKGYVSIPFITPTSRVDWQLNFSDMRFRRGPDLPEEKPKYRSLPGHEPRLFATTTLADPGEYVVIAEGEFCVLTLLQCGIPAVGLSGVSAWKDYYRNVFSGYERVIIMADNDEPKEGEKIGVGEKFANEIAKHVPNPRVIVVPEGKDTNGFYNLHGAAELRELIGV